MDISCDITRDISFTLYINSPTSCLSLCTSGDGRNDSPGYSAQYCTYTLIEHDTRDIVWMVTMDKRMTGLNSVIMEREALRKALTALKDSKLKVAELVTDAHVSIAAMMRKCSHQ